MEHNWFVEPLDAYTNEVISKEITEENFQKEMICSDGKKRNLWQCSGLFVSLLKRNEQQNNLKFKIFVQQGKGKIREANFLKRKRTKQKKRQEN